MPDGPIVQSNFFDHSFSQLSKKPEQFKIQCMSDIKALFPPDSNPFYAGYETESMMYGPTALLAFL
ncbi:hypothetical protein NQ317_018804 [Molorchus minor]|uniref:Lipin/Ned1/Smp2 (LNS2) domain-containing protein n=1 Tax=Molorchus minor TaxID=1323400 RepID=A0ABQ9IUW1_9CUCU|nr:hypothetical protein NQ317_018804 [Molorchus minor]